MLASSSCMQTALRMVTGWPLALFTTASKYLRRKRGGGGGGGGVFKIHRTLPTLAPLGQTQRGARNALTWHAFTCSRTRVAAHRQLHARLHWRASARATSAHMGRTARMQRAAPPTTNSLDVPQAVAAQLQRVGAQAQPVVW